MFFAKYKLLILLILFLSISAVAVWQASLIPLEDSNYNDRMVTVLNGFWTAFFALIFLGVSSIVQRVIKRESKHYNSLVRLETQLNEMIGVIQDNIHVLKGMKETIIKGNISWGNPKPIFIDKSHYADLHDLYLIDKVFSFLYGVRKLNDDIENMQKGYDDLKNAYIQKYVTVDHYVANAKEIAKVIDDLVLFLEETLDELMILYAHIRVQIKKDKTFVIWLQQHMIYTAGKRVTVDERDTEKLKLEGELQVSSQLSAKKIKKILTKKP